MNEHEEGREEKKKKKKKKIVKNFLKNKITKMTVQIKLVIIVVGKVL